ncbi:MAG: hypothetical protein WCJ19_02745 [bacterium]
MSKQNKKQNKSFKQFRISYRDISSIAWKFFAVLLMVAMLISTVVTIILFFIPKDSTNSQQIDPETLRQLQESIQQQQLTLTVAPTK